MVVGTVTSPAVRLSPNARNSCATGAGGRVTVTVNVHDRVVGGGVGRGARARGVAPTGNGDPDWRLQLTCTGDTPPVVVGGGNVTDTAAPVNDVVATFAGHEMVSGSPAGIVVVVVVGGTVVVVVVVVVGCGDGALGDEHASVIIRRRASATRTRLARTRATSSRANRRRHPVTVYRTANS